MRCATNRYLQLLFALKLHYYTTHLERTHCYIFATPVVLSLCFCLNGMNLVISFTCNFTGFPSLSHTHTLSNGHFTSLNVNFYSSKSIASVVADRTDAVEGTLKFLPSAAADVAEPATDGWCCVVPVAFRRPDAAKAAAAERRELLSRRML